MDEHFWDVAEGDASDAIFTIQACRALVEHTRDIVLLMTGEGRIVLANAAASLAYGRSREELKSLSIVDLRAPGTQTEVGRQMQRAAGEGVLFESEHLRADGSVFPVEVSSRGVLIAGRPHLLSVIRDISARRERDAERDSLLRDLSTANERLEGLLRIVSSAIGRIDLGHLLHEVLATLRDVMGADGVMLFVVDGEVLRLEAQDGYPEEVMRGFRMSRGEGFASAVAAAGEILWSQNVVATGAEIPIHHQLGIRSMFGLPLRIDGALYGVLECTWSTERLVSETERVMLQVASDRIVAAIAGAQRFEGTSRERLLESALASAASTLAESHDVAVTAASALTTMAEALECDVACFGRYENGRFEILNAFGTDARSILLPPHQALGESGSLDAWVTIPTEHPLSPWLLETFGVPSALVAPVKVRGGLSCAVLFGRRDPQAPIAPLEAVYCRRLADCLALAYANARDYQSEHRIAETLQEALLNLDGKVSGVRFGHLYRSSTLSTRVGGDFYDVFALGGGRVGVLVGDVSGKGLEAAVLTTIVKHTIRAFAHESRSPSDILWRSNEALAASSRLKDFASVALAVIDPADGTGAYCGAGHPPGLILREGGLVDSMSCGSPVLGAFTGLEYNECEFKIGSLDTLVLYTDGVTEARARDGEFFGDERLVEVLAASGGLGADALAGHLGSVVTEFTGGRLSDDVAIVTLSLA